MMMSDDKKKTATMIIAKMGSPMKEKPKNEMGDEEDASAGHNAAAEEILRAVESKDASALKEALKSFVSMCQDEESSDDMSEESEA